MKSALEMVQPVNSARIMTVTGNSSTDSVYVRLATTWLSTRAKCALSRDASAVPQIKPATCAVKGTCHNQISSLCATGFRGVLT